MLNKVISIIDINNEHNQYIETLLVANILEKKCNSLSVIDFNLYDKNKSLFSLDDCKKKGDFWSIKLFDRSNYTFPATEALNSLKMQDLVISMLNKNDVLLINPSFAKQESNIEIFKSVQSFIIFVDIKQNINNYLLNFFLKNNIKDKTINIFLYNFQDNIQNQKTFLSLSQQFQKNKNIKFDVVSNLYDFKKIDDIENIDPWNDIYKKINSAF